MSWFCQTLRPTHTQASLPYGDNYTPSPCRSNTPRAVSSHQWSVWECPSPAHHDKKTGRYVSIIAETVLCVQAWVGASKLDIIIILLLSYFV